MAFELHELHKAKMLKHETLSSKNRKEGDEPGQGIDIEIVLSNKALAMFAPELLPLLYQAAPGTQTPKQQQVDGLSDLPNLTKAGGALKRFPWHDEQTGMTVGLRWGISETPDLLPDCTLCRIRFQPKEGGSVVMRARIEAPNVPEKLSGRLPKMQGTEVDVSFIAPLPAESQEDLVTPAQRANTPPKGAKAEPEKKGDPLTPEAAFLASQRDELRDAKKTHATADA